MSKPPPSLDSIHKGRTNIYKIEAKYVRPRLLPDGTRFNTRSDFGSEAEQDELARLIAEHGIKDELLGTWKDGIFYYDDGDRRMRAYALAVEKYGLKGDKALIPIKRQPQTHTDKERTLDLLTLGTGKPHTLYEKGLAMQRLITSYEVKEDELPKLTGMSDTAVTNCLRLVTQAAPAVLQAVAEGKLSSTTAAELVREVNDTAKQTEVLEQAKEAAGDGKITAKDFPVKLGKEAQAGRRDLALAANEENLQKAIELLRVEKKISTSRLQRELRLGYTAASSLMDELENRGLIGPGNGSPAPRPLLVDLNAPPAAGEGEETDTPHTPANPFAGKEVGAVDLDDHGNFIETTDRPVPFTAQGVSAKIHLGSRPATADQPARWFAGVTLKWPGQSREDGFLHLKPNLKGTVFASNLAAEIFTLQFIRGELETKVFPSLNIAMADLDTALKLKAADLAASTPKAPGSTGSAGGSSAGAPLPNPVVKPTTFPDAAKLIDDVIGKLDQKEAEKDRLVTAKGIRDFLRGKIEPKELVKYLLGVTNKPEVKK